MIKNCVEWKQNLVANMVHLESHDKPTTQAFASPQS